MVLWVTESFKKLYREDRNSNCTQQGLKSSDTNKSCVTQLPWKCLAEVATHFCQLPCSTPWISASVQEWHARAGPSFAQWGTSFMVQVQESTVSRQWQVPKTWSTHGHHFISQVFNLVKHTLYIDPVLETLQQVSSYKLRMQ